MYIHREKFLKILDNQKNNPNKNSYQLNRSLDKKYPEAADIK
jgi:hypothetical protein